MHSILNPDSAIPRNQQEPAPCKPQSALKIGAVVMASGTGSRFRAALPHNPAVRFCEPEITAADRPCNQDSTQVQLTDSRPGGNKSCAAALRKAVHKPPDSLPGGNKLLADFRGQPVLSYVLHAAASPMISARITVTRSAEIEVLCRSLDFPCLLHEQPLLSDTIRLGLNALLQTAASRTQDCVLDGCIFFQGDQPLLTRASVENLIRTFLQYPDSICRLSFGGRPGSPVLFPRHLFPELLTLPPDRGGGFVIRRHPECVRLTEAQHVYELMDADTPEALEALIYCSARRSEAELP